MLISKLFEGLEAERYIGVDGTKEIAHLTNDYKTAESSSVFFAINGEKVNGNFYSASVLQKGGVVVTDSEIFAHNHLISGGKNLVFVPSVRRAMSKISANFYGNPQEKLRVIMVVGTNGKTSTACIIRDIFEYAGVRTGIIGTLETRFEDLVFESGMTTPDPIQLFQIFSAMQKAGAKVVVMEASAHAIYLEKLYGITAEIAVFTNLSQDHLDFFGDMESYKNAKKSFFARENVKTAVVNSDSDLGREIIAEGKLPIISYGIENMSDVFCIFASDMQKFTSKIMQDKTAETPQTGGRFIVNYLDEICEIYSPLHGRFNIYNVLAGITVARFFGIEFPKIKEGVRNLKPIAGRYQQIENTHGIEIVVDYAHTPDGMENILSAMKKTCNGKLITVFGCGGNRDASKRKVMGDIAEKYSNAVVITSDNPRFENPEDIANDILQGMKNRESAIIVLDRKKAIEYAISMCERGDSLAILGKGHEEYIEENGERSHFSDVEVVEKYI